MASVMLDEDLERLEWLNPNIAKWAKEDDLPLKNYLMPNWWQDNENYLYCSNETAPNVIFHPGKGPPIECSIYIGKNASCPELLIWDGGALVYIRRNVRFKHGRIVCGGKSSVLIDSYAAFNGTCNLNARNGGAIFVGKNVLCAASVSMQTDDMHTIYEVNTGERVNKYGSKIVLCDRVWVGYDTLIGPGSNIGTGTVIGARSFVSGHIPNNCIAVGSPAKVIRTGTDWCEDDLTPDECLNRYLPRP